MKKTVIILLCLLMTSAASAKRISESEAYTKAEQFMAGKTLKQGARLQKAPGGNETFKNLYIFNAEADGGFAIVSGDDRMPAILGYGPSGELSPETMPCNMGWLLSCYEQTISALPADEGGVAYDADASRSVSDRKDIAPLISSQWGQHEPYNALCPEVGTERCLTGCVATAMAQIINYYKWPQENTKGVSAYTTRTLNLSMPSLPPTRFDWDNMDDDEIAKLMQYCGQSTRMDYAPDGSGAYNADLEQALKDVFGYSKSVEVVSRGSYSDNVWDALLYGELAQGRPVIYTGVNYGWEGHAFIADGYEAGRYHINWGWAGLYDGYFYLDNLAPAPEAVGFDYLHAMCVNICPSGDAGGVDRAKAIVSGMESDKLNLGRPDETFDFPPFTISAYINSDLSEKEDMHIGLALYGDEGLVKVLSEDVRDFKGLKDFYINQKVTIEVTLPKGEYRIVAVNRGSDTDPWVENTGSNVHCVRMMVDDTCLKLRSMQKRTEEQDDNIIEYGVYTIDGVTYRLYSEYGNLRARVLPYNEKEKYAGDIYIPDYVNFHNLKFDLWNKSGVSLGVLSRCPDLESLSTSFANFSLYDCPKLSRLELREGVMKASSIYEFDELESVVFPESCMLIAVPHNCKSMKSITFSNKRNLSLVAYEHLWQEESMPALTDVYFESSIPPALLEATRMAVNDKVKIHIPIGSLDAYQHSVWKDWNFVEDQPAQTVSVNWDYCGVYDGQSYYGSPLGIMLGRGDNDVEFAMRIPAEQIAAYSGNKITAIEFYAPECAADDRQLEDVEYVFLTSRGSDYLIKEAVNTVRERWMRVELSQPYIITGEEIFVGIGRHGALRANWANFNIAEDGFWLRTMGPDDTMETPGEWYKHGGIEDWNYSLPIRAIIEGDNLPTDVAMSSIDMYDDYGYGAKKWDDTYSHAVAADVDGSRYFSYTTDADGRCYIPQKTHMKPSKAPGISRKVAGIVRNRAPKPVERITLNLNIDGVSYGTHVIDTPLQTNQEEVFFVDIPSDLGGRYHDISINVSDIDGEEDAIPENSNPRLLFIYQANVQFPRITVYEYAISTLDGWSPRGIASMNCYRPHSDTTILVSVHDDEMLPAAGCYDYFLDQVPSYPYACLDRRYWFDPDPNTMTGSGIAADASILVSAKFVEDNKIEVATNVEFGFSDNANSDYRIAYVLKEDNVGPYLQANFYSNPDIVPDPYDNLGWWKYQDESVEYVFNDVARAIYDYEGVPGLFPDEITEGLTYGQKRVIDIPDNVQEAANLKVVTMLIDGFTGEVMNAAQTSISGTPPSGITDVAADASGLFDVYNVQGIKVRSRVSGLDGLPKGIYIVNGEKVLVK